VSAPGVGNWHFPYLNDEMGDAVGGTALGAAWLHDLAHVAEALREPFLSSPSQVMTSGRVEIRRSLLLTSNASTEDTNERRTEMGKIVMSGPQNVSLDGVVQDPDGEEGFRLGGWFNEFGGKDLEEWNKVALAEALGAEAWLLGRRSYEFFGLRWRPRSGELADRLNSMPKYVVSSTLVDPDWNNTTVVKGDVVTEVSRLKRELDGEIVVPASYQLGRALMEHDLVDELRVVVFPVVLGAGERFFGEISDKKPMRLVDTKTIGDGLAFLTYKTVRDA
jgi:dihydrofolate reductase